MTSSSTADRRDGWPILIVARATRLFESGGDPDIGFSKSFFQIIWVHFNIPSAADLFKLFLRGVKSFWKMDFLSSPLKSFAHGSNPQKEFGLPRPSTP